MAEKNLNRRSRSKRSSLTAEIFLKLTVEDVFSWVQYAFKELKNNAEMIAETFVTCGYITDDQR